ncbi:ABC transporter ATP-binding protein [Helicobacter sp. 23-1045]
MDYVLEIRDLCKNYGATNALNNVNLKIERGEIVGLLGPNGSGKTTMLKIINGLVNNYNGEVRILGQNLNVESKGKVAFLPDSNFVPQSWSIARLLEFFGDFFDDFNKARALALFRELDINLDSRFKSLSKGTKEKVQLCLILSRDAEIYMFDEPIAGVDPKARDLIFRLILDNYNKDASIIISTHLVRDVESILSSAIFLRYGEVVAYDSLANLKAKYGDKNLEDIFKELV